VLESLEGGRDEVVFETQQPLDDTLALLVTALAEVVMPDSSFHVGDVHGWPVVVVEGAPDSIVTVEGDRIFDPHLLRGLADVVDVVLEWELRRVDADHDQPLILVLLVPRADVAERAQPVDARVGAEVDEDDLPAQAHRRQPLGVEPAGRAFEPRKGLVPSTEAAHVTATWPPSLGEVEERLVLLDDVRGELCHLAFSDVPIAWTASGRTVDE
jgi:hypothetical protein